MAGCGLGRNDYIRTSVTRRTVQLVAQGTELPPAKKKVMDKINRCLSYRIKYELSWNGQNKSYSSIASFTQFVSYVFLDIERKFLLCVF